MKFRSLAYPAVHRAADGRAGWLIALLWGIAEGLWWPIVPDLWVFSATLAAPRRWWRLALLASAGSVVGGTAAYLIARTSSGAFPVLSLPLIVPEMVEQAGTWLAGSESTALLHQPLSGIPYKVFAYLAGDQGVGLAGFIAFSALARSLRIFTVGLVAGALGAIGGKWFWSRTYDVVMGTILAAFAVGLARVVSGF